MLLKLPHNCVRGSIRGINVIWTKKDDAVEIEIGDGQQIPAIRFYYVDENYEPNTEIYTGHKVTGWSKMQKDYPYYNSTDRYIRENGEVLSQIMQ